jgi:hypothetical protein
MSEDCCSLDFLFFENFEIDLESFSPVTNLAGRPSSLSPLMVVSIFQRT